MSETVKIGKKAQIVILKTTRQKMKISEGDSPVPKPITDIAGIAKELYEENYINKVRDTWYVL